MLSWTTYIIDLRANVISQTINLPLKQYYLQLKAPYEHYEFAQLLNEYNEDVTILTTERNFLNYEKK